MVSKNEKRNLALLFIVVVIVGMGMLIWGQYNTGKQVYEISFNRYMVEKQLETDETWVKSADEKAIYDTVYNEGKNWRENTENRQGVFNAKTASEIFGKTEPQEINYEFFDNGSDTTVILLHAYNETTDDAAVFAPYWWAKGFNVLIPTMRGHSEAGGTTTFGCYEQYDLLDLIRQESLNNDGSSLIIHGKGIGAASALLLAGNTEFNMEASIDFVVSDNTYGNLKDLELKQLKQQYSLGNLMVGVLLDMIVKSNLGFTVKDVDVTLAAASINAPTVFITGDSDGFIGYEQTSAVYDACNSEKNLTLIKGAGYSMSYAVSKSSVNEYEKLLDEWLTKLNFSTDAG